MREQQLAGCDIRTTSEVGSSTLMGG